MLNCPEFAELTQNIEVEIVILRKLYDAYGLEYQASDTLSGLMEGLRLPDRTTTAILLIEFNIESPTFCKVIKGLISTQKSKIRVVLAQKGRPSVPKNNPKLDLEVQSTFQSLYMNIGKPILLILSFYYSS